MKNGLLTAGILMAGLVVFAGTLTVAGTALRQPPRDVILAVRTTEETQTKPQLQFPYSVEGTSLTVERLAVYEGPMIEQESDEPSVNALALILRNGEDRVLRSVQLTLESTNGTYRFDGTCIPGQSSVLLIEINGALWKNEAYTECAAVVEYAEDAGFSAQEVEITQLGMGEISLTNLTENRLRDVRIFHKNCLGGADIFVGGITYQTPVGDLEPGQTVQIIPRHYAADYSKVVRVEGIPEE